MDEADDVSSSTSGLSDSNEDTSLKVMRFSKSFSAAENLNHIEKLERFSKSASYALKSSDNSLENAKHNDADEARDRLLVKSRVRRRSEKDHQETICLNDLDDLGDGEDDWQNRSRDLFLEQQPDADYEKMETSQFEDAHNRRSGIFDSLGGKLKEISYNLNSVTTLPDGRAPSCPRSVGGSGLGKIVNNPSFPAHGLFRPGTVFRVCVRHNNLSYEDDAMLDGRVACLRLNDLDPCGPLDLILHTGKVPQYYNADSFNEFREAFHNGPDALRRWTFKKPMNYYSRVENVRRTPKSYYDQRYYSQISYLMKHTDGVLRLARVRLIPADGSIQTGLPDKIDQESIWKTDRRHSDIAPQSYLRDEYCKRLTATPIQYRLQIQTRIFDDSELYDELNLSDAVRMEQKMNDKETEKPGKSTKLQVDTEDKEFAKFRMCNSCIQWDDLEYSWSDLAIITVTTPLDEKDLSSVKFSLSNSLGSFKPASPACMKDFNSLVIACREFHGIDFSKSNSCNEVSIKCKKRTRYEIAVKTGKRVNAGTDADVLITIFGLKGQSHTLSLDKRFRNDFEAGNLDVFEEEIFDVGDILLINVNIRTSLQGRRWFLEYITITDAIENVVFPCYKWLTSKYPSVSLPRAEAVLPHEDVLLQRYLHRKFEIATQRQRYQWQTCPGYPGRLLVKSNTDIPHELQFINEKDFDLDLRFRRNVATLRSGLSINFFHWNILDDNKKLLLQMPGNTKLAEKIASDWNKDEEFGRQILNGSHPNRVERVNRLPKEFRHEEELLSRLMPRGHSVSSEIKSGRVFMITYPELDRVSSGSNNNSQAKHCLCSPTCLLYARRDGHMVPLAISLSPLGTSADGLVWTPRDTYADWTLAKMWVRNADAHVHLVCTRYLYTQVVMESVAVATFRNLPSVHPVYKLLMPHLKHNLALNALERKNGNPQGANLFSRLLTIGPDYDELLKNAYGQFTLNDLHLPVAFHNAGVMNRDILSSYYYRDDALCLWKIINKLVRTVLTLHYRNSTSVQRDHELQDWILDLHENGLPNWNERDLREVPFAFTSLKHLVEFTTLVMFTASCQRSALTSGILDTYGYVPNAPTCLSVPPPNCKGMPMGLTTSLLPNKAKTGEVLAACYTLSQQSKDEVLLGEFSEMLWADEATKQTIQAFKEELSSLEETIQERNRHLDVPYEYLLPSRIVKGVKCDVMYE